MWAPKPRFPVDPDPSIIESLSRISFQMPVEHLLTAIFLPRDTFNKVYTVITSDDGGVERQFPSIFCATLPVESFYKTASEAATLSYN